MNSKDELIERFAREIKKVGGLVKILNKEEEVVEYIKDTAAASGSKLVVISSKSILSSKIRSALGLIGVACYLTDELKPTEARSILTEADLGITDSDFAVAETGSIVLGSEKEIDRLVTCLPKIHVAIVRRERILNSFTDLSKVIAGMQRGKIPVVSIITGPSRTADIEHELVIGVHGPLEVHIIVFDGDYVNG